MFQAMNTIERRIYQLAKPYLTVRYNDLHTRVALQYALGLLKQLEGDRRVIGPAIILHDVGWIRVPEEQFRQWCSNPSDESLVRIHEQESVKIARAILSEVDYDNSLRDEVLRIIAVHDTGGDALSTNEKIVRDADVLYRYSKTGFRTSLRTFGLMPEERLEQLESRLDKWLIMPVSREIAREQLEQRKREAEAS